MIYSLFTELDERKLLSYTSTEEDIHGGQWHTKLRGEMIAKVRETTTATTTAKVKEAKEESEALQKKS